MHVESSNSTGADGDISSRSPIHINVGHVSADINGTHASIDMSGLDMGNYTWNETHEGHAEYNENSGSSRNTSGQGVDFQVDLTGNLKIDWADLERVANQWGVQ